MPDCTQVLFSFRADDDLQLPIEHSHHMMHHHPMLAEVVAAILTAVQGAVAAFMLAVLPASEAELASWTLLPLIGATLAAGGAFCLNTQQEVRKIVVGRCLFAVVVGVIVPRLFSMMHPWVAEVLGDTLLKVGAGFVFGFGGYVLSWPFVKKAYERAPAVAAQHINSLEKKMVEAVAVQAVAKELTKDQPTPKEEPLTQRL